MKIIRRGLDTSDREWKFNCIKCGSLFECAEKEGERIEDPRDGGTLKVNCPVCTRPTYGSTK